MLRIRYIPKPLDFIRLMCHYLRTGPETPGLPERALPDHRAAGKSREGTYMDHDQYHVPEAVLSSVPGQPARVVQENIPLYYSNCAMLGTSGVDLSIYFGRLTPASHQSGDQIYVEFYERQIALSFDQARKLAMAMIHTLNQMDQSAQAASAAQQDQALRAHPGTGHGRPKAWSVPGAPASPSVADLDMEISVDDLQGGLRQHPELTKPKAVAHAAGSASQTPRMKV